MIAFNCPKCNQPSFSWQAKYAMAYWIWRVCSQCNAKVCANPIILSLFHMLYFWVLAFFIYLAFYQKQFLPVLYLVVIWIIIDILNIWLLPLSYRKNAE